MTPLDPASDGALRPFFIINPQSSAVRKRGSRLEKIAQDREIPMVHTQLVSELPDILKAALDTGANWICIEGGDGTIQATMTAYMEIVDQLVTHPRFSLLPGGMTNQVARQIGLKRPGRKRITAILDGKDPEISQMPMLDIQLGKDTQKHGFLFSTGALPMATQYYFDHVHKDGKGGAGAVTQMIVKGFTGNDTSREQIYRASPLSLRVTGNKEETHLDQDHLTTVVTTLPGLMLGLDPFWGDGDGALRLTYVREDAQRILRHLISLWTGQKNKSRAEDGIESFNAEVLRYKYKGPVVLDGESLHTPDGHIEIRATEPIEFWR